MSDDGNIVSVEKVEKYLELTLEARNKATPITNNVEDERRLSVMLKICLLYTSPSPRDLSTSRMPSSA